MHREKNQDLVMFDQSFPTLCSSHPMYTPILLYNDRIDLYDPGNDLEIQISRWHPPISYYTSYE